ncbi:MAG TPA: DUF1643 domain-containing protein [Verrucomicrobiae bacterium]|nr:DUF1643 domain-containing protein [Verrucomicrobiae bacterium]
MSAVISDCTLYRYRLERRWYGYSTLMFVMVNPSTADAVEDDQTIKKCIGFAKRAGYGRILVGNKFAFRATDVNKLREQHDPIGPDNDAHLREMMCEADCVVAGWGQLAKLPESLRKRWYTVVRLADQEGKALHCIGVNADKHPKHPQMTGYDVPIAPWDVPFFIGRNRPLSAGERKTP